MMIYQKKEIVAGLILLMATTQQNAKAMDSSDTGDEAPSSEESADSVLEPIGSNVLEILVHDNEQATPPTPVNGGYFTGYVLQERIQANWLSSEVGLQIVIDDEKLDPRRYHVEWKLMAGMNPAVKARLVHAHDFNFGQQLHIETPLHALNGDSLANLEVEVRITDRTQPDKPPVVIVQTLREMLANGRDGL